jgi:solute carrier family 25 (mitochondrial carnitine/acylcarnitine transporter), member 20/29|mmetsp:Transcript_16726/g.31359  ORF Transcript_16726/g.31359 Transcript_16726/m.31359 type:complete len:325 (+) Transcript_16726:379-1353(+)|eukprot:CAMPEP_0182491646 /NCGR_PEP_ID=MMETSP1321-20130603/990_1 /TAXON_ID=91990 /ORGANISM="Bolidomonas sp., Strain RCC1657" /LENGTH=324 /DNA_ID=CAMNT_0024693933 /DNA_START=380 /DNA_END=1354 /DNA_ORIENTATION=+
MEPIVAKAINLKTAAGMKAKLLTAKFKLTHQKATTLFPSSSQKRRGEDVDALVAAGGVGAISSVSIVAAGAVGGAANCIVGHPLDTMKVIAQSSPKANLSMTKISRTLWNDQGIAGFYRGVTPPLFASCSIGSAFWLISTAAKEWVCEAGQTKDQLRPSQVILASQLTAPIYSCVVCPIEVIKCRMQADPTITNPAKCVMNIAKREGVLQLWAGLMPTYLRRATGLPFFFVAHDLVKKETGSTLLGGFVGGTLYWGVSYPLDVIKTRMHSSTKGQLATAKQLIRESGIKGLYRGVAPALMRAGPSNGIYFIMYEKALELFSGRR